MPWLYINYNNIQSVYENSAEITTNFEQLVTKMYDFKLPSITWYGLHLLEKKNLYTSRKIYFTG